MAARRKAVTNSAYKFITLTSDCGQITQAEFSTDDDTFLTIDDAVANAKARYDEYEEKVEAIYIVEVIGVVKSNKAAFKTIGDGSVYDLGD
jgi:hypothetical protein